MKSFFDNFLKKTTDAKVDNKAPQFVTENINGNKFSLNNQNSKRILLSFFPYAWKDISIEQVNDLEKNYNTFRRYGTEVAGISVESKGALKAWSRINNINEIKLLPDFWPHGDISKKYRLFRSDYGLCKRANVIINEQNTVVFRKIYHISEVPNTGEIIEFVR